MQALLREYTVLGVVTNRQFLLDVISSPAFTDGETDTGFLAQHLPVWRPEHPLSNDVIALAALGDMLYRHGQLASQPVAVAHALGDATMVTPWQRYDGWRLGGRS
jgi:acetyl/propionyl-CoA carboxylase alpha subunit